MEEIIDDTASQTSDDTSTVANVDTQIDAQSDDLAKKNKQLFERAKKAEAEAKELKAKLAEAKPKEAEIKPMASKSEYTLQDIRALADVHDDDVPKIEKLAKLEGTSIAEAKKSSLGQAILRDGIENRKSAEAANIGVAKRGVTKVSDEAILEEVAQGKLPDTDEGIAKLTAARMAAKLKK